MSRLRNDHPGAWHHVMNRGARREPIFQTARDARRFLDLAGELSTHHGVEIHAYCLMRNHFHLLVRSADGGLAGFMQQLSSAYTREVNRRLGHDGAIFRGRYRSKRIDSDAYLVTAARYIHRNPVDVRPPVRLEAYRWSSFGAMIGTREPESWLHLAEVRGWFGGDLDALREHVEGRARMTDLELLAAIGEVALDEQFFDREVVRLGRPLTLAVAAELGLPSSAVDDALGFPSAGSRRTALSRVTSRLQTDTALASAVRRTLDTAA